MGVTYCFRKDDHVVIVMPYMKHQPFVVSGREHKPVACSGSGLGWHGPPLKSDWPPQYLKI